MSELTINVTRMTKGDKNDNKEVIMSDLLIIVTKMSGTGDHEFKIYFPNCNCWAIKNLCHKGSQFFITSNNSLIFDYGDKFLIVDGFTINTSDTECKQLGNYIKCAYKKKSEITMLIHPGTILKNEDAQNRIFKYTNINISKSPNKIKFEFYSGLLNISFDQKINEYIIAPRNTNKRLKKVKCD